LHHCKDRRKEAADQRSVGKAAMLEAQDQRLEYRHHDAERNHVEHHGDEDEGYSRVTAAFQ
jgi:hypothetical protein